MDIVILKYNAGNIRSVDYALRRLGVQATITDDHDLIRQADKVIFPGVGEAKYTIEYLRKHGLDKLLLELKNPVLGICLGMQLMCRHSEEGDVSLLGIFDQEVKRFQSPNNDFKVPHMGWNTLSDTTSPLFRDVKEEESTYFVHSYYVPVCEDTIATTDYIHPFSAALHKDNYYATQFHPEKSAGVGECILKNFLEL